MTIDRYADLCAAHRWEVPASFNIAAACCGRWAEDRARFALYWEDESGVTAAHTFWDLQQRANRLANALGALGIGRGDKVALLLPQRPETVIAHIAVYQLGAIAVPLSFLFGPEALALPPRTTRGEGCACRRAIAAEFRCGARGSSGSRPRHRRRPAPARAT
jgi:acetyl-CoA synthetase